jgi:biotin carboxyl carrier protein
MVIPQAGHRPRRRLRRSSEIAMRLIPATCGPAVALFDAGARGSCGGTEQARPPPLGPIRDADGRAAGGDAGAAWDGVVHAVSKARRCRRRPAAASRRSRFDVNERVAAATCSAHHRCRSRPRPPDAARAAARRRSQQHAEASRTRVRSRQGPDRKKLISQARFRPGVKPPAMPPRPPRCRARRGAQAAQQSAYTVVRAPYAGVVASRHVEPGETVRPASRCDAGVRRANCGSRSQVPQTRAEAIAAIREACAAVLLPDGREVAPPGGDRVPGGRCRQRTASTCACACPTCQPQPHPAPRPRSCSRCGSRPPRWAAGTAHPAVRRPAKLTGAYVVNRASACCCASCASALAWATASRCWRPAGRRRRSPRSGRGAAGTWPRSASRRANHRE